ncbi:hypothetical protein N7465_003932 [Penicillium sp. CMV-2018d]|nr:hypothetical protein N7465_003932 [Penicillium sp. CMV-2018d]
MKPNPSPADFRIAPSLSVLSRAHHVISISPPTFQSVRLTVSTAPLYGHKRTLSPRASSSSSGTPQFTFVTGNTQSEARSHAMKEHNQQAKIHHQKRLSRTLPLLPKSGINEAVSPPEDAIRFSGLQQTWDINVVNNGEKYSSIPAQLLCGVSYALSSSKPDPFQTCPVHLTSQHQKLLHHCTWDPLANNC